MPTHQTQIFAFIASVNLPGDMLFKTCLSYSSRGRNGPPSRIWRYDNPCLQIIVKSSMHDLYGLQLWQRAVDDRYALVIKEITDKDRRNPMLRQPTWLCTLDTYDCTCDQDDPSRLSQCLRSLLSL